MLYSLLREWRNRRFQPAMTPSRLPNTLSTSQGKIRCSSYREETHTHNNKKHTLTFACLTNNHIQASISLWQCKSWLQWSQQRTTKLHSSFVSLSKTPTAACKQNPSYPQRPPHASGNNGLHWSGAQMSEAGKHWTLPGLWLMTEIDLWPEKWSQSTSALNLHWG